MECEAVLTAWYDEYSTDVLRYCSVFLRNRADAEDATQETFLKVCRNVDRFEARNNCSPKSWIIRIAANTCKDFLRKAWRKHEKPLTGEEEQIRPENTVEENRELIMDVMNLPEKYRNVILMVYWQGMTIREAAACTSTSISTVCRRLEKAKKMIA